jgi:choline dehydrogenase-like flavoprotein
MNETTSQSDVIVLGAGMAGASLAAELAEKRTVTLLEIEDQPGRQATGRSAAMFIESYGNETIRALTRASRSFFCCASGWIRRSPVADPACKHGHRQYRKSANTRPYPSRSSFRCIVAEAGQRRRFGDGAHLALRGGSRRVARPVGAISTLPRCCKLTCEWLGTAARV